MEKFVVLLLAFGLAVPAAAMGQDGDEGEREATVISISSYQCPNSVVAGLTDDYDTVTKPLEEAVIADGMMASAGLFFHAWSDEWNVHYYRTGYSIQGLLDAIAEVGARATAANPDAAAGQGPFAECTSHKDNIYFLGPRTGDGG